jgi:hypothetical protein
LGGALFTMAQLRNLCFRVTTTLTCVFPSLANDMHIVGFTLNGFFLTIPARVFNIKTFNVANEVCSLVFTRVRPLDIISS